jgi:predicted amidohydrolase YtcJ
MFDNPLKIIGSIILGGLFFISCAAAQTPTLVIINADVRTMDRGKPKVEAVAVADNKITAVGTNTEIRRLIGPETGIIDARGRLVLPGFNDSHVHFFSIGARFFVLDLKKAKTPEDVLDGLRLHSRFLPAGQWLIGNFRTETEHALSVVPNKEAVDLVTPDHPVLLYLKGAEIALANTSALNMAGIERFSAESRSTGILRGPEVQVLRNRIPPVSYGSSPRVAETATNYAAAVGVTSVQDVHSDDSFEIYRQLEKDGKLKTRVYDCLSLKDWEKLAARQIRRAAGDPMVRRGCLKYASNGEREEIPDLIKPIAAADRAGLQVMMHAIGSSPNDIVLTIFEEVLKQNGPRDRRFRIEHARGFLPEDLKRFVATGTIASMQPFLFFDRSGDDARLFRQMRDAKALLAFGSDANIVEMNPLLGIHAAVYGETSDRGMTIEEAVRAYTLEAAYAEFQEGVKGSIAVGKLADLVLLSENIFTIEPERIDKVKVLQTIMDGRIVYEAQ